MKAHTQSIKVAVFGDEPSRSLVSSLLSHLEGIVGCVDVSDQHQDIAIFFVHDVAMEQVLVDYHQRFPLVPTIVVASIQVHGPHSAALSEPLSTQQLLETIELLLANNRPSTRVSPLCVAVMARSNQRRDQIKAVIEGQGIQVELSLNFVETSLQQLDATVVDALIVELDDNDDDSETDFIFDYAELPVIFCDQESLTPTGIADWSRKLSVSTDIVNGSNERNDNTIAQANSVPVISTDMITSNIAEDDFLQTASTFDINAVVRVAVMANAAQQAQFKSLQSMSGLEIVIQLDVSEQSLQQLETVNVDVVLADLSHTDGADFMFDYAALPVVFFDQDMLMHNKGVSDEWVNKLKSFAPTQPHNEFNQAIAVVTIGESQEGLPQEKTQSVTALPAVEPPDNPAPALLDIIDTPWEHPSTSVGSDDEGDALSVTWSEFDVNDHAVEEASDVEKIWILAASIGGPPVVKRFLQAIPSGLSVSYILAQHIGENFLSVMAERLNNICALSVRPAVDGDELLQRGVLVVPVDRKFNLDIVGKVKLTPIENPHDYTPNIDDVIEQVANRYEALINVIIFSGMGKDSLKGAQKVAQMGGQVWTLDATSCVARKMPAAAHKLGIVSFSGNPKQLAKQLVKHMQN